MMTDGTDVESVVVGDGCLDFYCCPSDLMLTLACDSRKDR
jgi:hypothetical protein